MSVKTWIEKKLKNPLQNHSLDPRASIDLDLVPRAKAPAAEV